MKLQPLLLTLLLLAAAPAWAQVAEPQAGPASETLALEAHQVLMDHCALAAGGATTRAAQSAVVVSDVWARVSAQLEATEELYLLYWRGVLEQCLDWEDRALNDLEAFAAAPIESDLLLELVRDARRRIRRLKRKLGQRRGKMLTRQQIGGVVLGCGLALGAGVSGGLSGWQWAEAVALDNQLRHQVNESSEIPVIRAELEAAQDASRGLLGVGLGLGVASVVVFVVTATAREDAGGRAGIAPPVALPLPGGAAVLWQGRW